MDVAQPIKFSLSSKFSRILGVFQGNRFHVKLRILSPYSNRIFE